MIFYQFCFVHGNVHNQATCRGFMTALLFMLRSVLISYKGCKTDDEWMREKTWNKKEKWKISELCCKVWNKGEERQLETARFTGDAQPITDE